jgi:signal transduction histidine kinase
MITEAGAQRWSIVTIRDTTEVANLQEALRRSESMAALGTLLGGVAHEVRNPLFGILATLQLFEGRLRSQPGFEECRTLLQANVQRLLELMQELLDYARPMPAAFAEADLSAVVEQAVGACLTVAGQRDVTIRNAVPPELAPFRMDRRRLVQVFQNVISNAVAFSPSGTTVTVSARLAGGDVCCEIEDCGPGFTAEEMPHVFEPFFSRRRDGTGLGLSIARRIVEAHAGTITAANRPSMTGGLIRITLPRSGVPPEPGR